MEENAPPPIPSEPPVAPGSPVIPPPPLIAPPPPGRPKSKGRFWMVVALIALLLLTATWLGNLVHAFHSFGSLAKGGRHGGAHYEETLIEDNNAHDKIAVVDVMGIITGHDLDGDGRSLPRTIKDQLDLAAEDKAVKAVILRVDSPGGEVLASDEIYRAIKEFQKNSGKPVVASMGGLAASGGYYVSAPCQWIVANELTITGSIGVIMQSYNYRGLMNKVGVQPMVFKSGKFKDMLSGEKSPEEVLPEEKEMVQALIDETFSKFKSIVREGRTAAEAKNHKKGRPLVESWTDLADGRILSGRQAFDSGFVDELGDFDTAVERTLKIAGIEEANLIQYQQPFELANLLRLFGKSESRALKVDWGVELPKLNAGRLYFLSSTVLH